MSMRTPRSPWSQPRQSPRLSPVGEACNVYESYVTKQIVSRTDCSHEMVDLLKTTRGLHPTDLTMQARNRERCWGSLQLAWLARNTFEEWRNVALIANLSGVVSTNNSKNDTREDCKFISLSQLQNELAAKDDLIAQLRQDLKDASAKHLREKLENIIGVVDTTIEIRGAVHERTLLKRWVLSCLHFARSEAKLHDQVQRLEAVVGHHESNPESVFSDNRFTQSLKNGERVQRTNSKLRLQCYNAWLSYCNDCRFVAELEQKHQEQLFCVVEEFNSKGAAAVRAVVLTTASTTLDLHISVDPFATFRTCFSVWCQYHYVRRSKIRNSLKMVDHLNCIRSRVSLLELCSAWSQLIQQVRISRRARSLRRSVQIVASKQTQRLYEMQARDNLLYTFLEWSVLVTRHCRLTAKASSCRDMCILRFHSKIFRAWAQKCGSLKLFTSVDRISLLAATPLYEASIRNIFLCWRLDIVHSCRRRENCAYQESMADANAEKMRRAAECNAEIIERTANLSACLRKNALFNRIYLYDSICEAKAFSAWKDFHNDSVNSLLIRRRDSQWIMHYRSLHDSASIFMWVRFMFDIWHFDTGFDFQKTYSKHHQPFLLRKAVLPCRVFMHWMFLINHDAWRRKQQELGSLLTQARAHVSNAEADRLECRDSIHALAHRNIRSEAYLTLYLVYSKWRGFIVDIRNMEVVERLINDRQIAKAQFEARISCLVDNNFVGQLILIAYLVLYYWRQDLINSRMQRSLAYVQNMATNIRHQVMRRIQEKRQTLLSSCLDTWRWMVDSAIQRRRNCSDRSSQPILTRPFERTLCDGQHHKTYETYARKSSVLSLQGSPTWPGQVIDSRVNVSPRSMASVQLGVLRG